MARESNLSITTGQVTVAATAGGTLIAAARPGRTRITITNHGTTAFYVGVEGVTALTGLLVPGVVGASVELDTGAAIYGITASGTQAASFAEVS